MRRKTNDEFTKEVYNLVGDRYVFLEKYKTTHDKLKVEHLECKTVYNASPANFLSGHRCRKCSMKRVHDSQRRSTQEVINELWKNQLTLIGFPNGYQNCFSKITVECEDGHISTKSIHSAIHFGGCPKCKSSKGESKIRGILTVNKVRFKEQYRFNDCRFKYPLPFDFAVFDDDGGLRHLIEYDGEQHYIPYRTEDGLEKLKETQRNDIIKSDYCANNNINLIRIPYWEFDGIEDILKSVKLERR